MVYAMDTAHHRHLLITDLSLSTSIDDVLVDREKPADERLIMGQKICYLTGRVR
jgi:hypothetical protein